MFIKNLVSFYYLSCNILRFSVGLSDSDSEMEARLKEAAVSVKDLLPSLTPTLSAELPCSGKIKKKKKVAEGEGSHVVKKKKRKKQNGEESDSAGSPHDAQSNDEQEHVQVKVKRKKKKKREGNAEEEASN